MIRGTAQWSYDPTVRAWYIKLDECALPPFTDNDSLEVTVDLDSDGRLAGIEFFTNVGPPLRAEGKN